MLMSGAVVIGLGIVMAVAVIAGLCRQQRCVVMSGPAHRIVRGRNNTCVGHQQVKQCNEYGQEHLHGQRTKTKNPVFEKKDHSD